MLIKYGHIMHCDCGSARWAGLYHGHLSRHIAGSSSYHTAQPGILARVPSTTGQAYRPPHFETTTAACERCPARKSHQTRYGPLPNSQAEISCQQDRWDPDAATRLILPHTRASSALPPSFSDASPDPSGNYRTPPKQPIIWGCSGKASRGCFGLLAPSLLLAGFVVCGQQGPNIS